MGFGYLSAAIIALIVLLAFKKYAQDRALWRRVKRNLPQAGAAGRFIVLSAGSRRLPAGTELRVPFEGTLGGSMSCDVCVPYKKVHMRSAFFWVEGEELHLVPLHKDGFLADETPIEPGDEAVMRDGAILRVGELKLVLRMYDRGELADGADEPYVTSARRSKAGQGRGDGLGAPTRGAIRREKKKLNQSEADEKKRASAAQKERKERQAEVTAWPAAKSIRTSGRTKPPSINPSNRKRAPSKRKRRKKRKKPNAERPNAMSRNSSFPAGKSGKRRALPPSPETDGAPSAARAMRA